MSLGGLGGVRTAKPLTRPHQYTPGRSYAVMEEEVSIKARGFQCCRDERWRVCGDGLQTTTFYWQFFIDLVLQAESWCLVLQIKQKRQRFRLWAFGQTSRAASLHTLCQLFFHDVWFVTNGLLCVVTLMTSQRWSFQFLTSTHHLQVSMWNLYPVISAKTPHCSPFIPSMEPSQDGDALFYVHVWLISDR